MNSAIAAGLAAVLLVLGIVGTLRWLRSLVFPARIGKRYVTQLHGRNLRLLATIQVILSLILLMIGVSFALGAAGLAQTTVHGLIWLGLTALLIVVMILVSALGVSQLRHRKSPPPTI